MHTLRRPVAALLLLGSALLATTGTAACSVSSSAPAPSGSGGATTASTAAQGFSYEVSYRQLKVALPGAPAKGTVAYPAVTVSGGSQPVRAAITRAIQAQIDAARSSFVKDAADMADAAAGIPSEQEITVVGQVRWGSLYSVQFRDYRGISGMAHPVTNSLAVTVDERTGHEVRAADLFPAIGPVDTAVRAALRAKGVGPESLATITVGPATATAASVAAYPTTAGLHVGVSQCVATCALGVVEVTVPWNRLPATEPGVLPSSAG